MLERYFEAYVAAVGRGRHWMLVENGNVTLCTERDGKTYTHLEPLSALRRSLAVPALAGRAAARTNDENAR